MCTLIRYNQEKLLEGKIQLKLGIFEGIEHYQKVHKNTH